jgi:hypothetical protein
VNYYVVNGKCHRYEGNTEEEKNAYVVFKGYIQGFLDRNIVVMRGEASLRPTHPFLPHAFG